MSETITIDRNLPVPTMLGRAFYPFAKMEPGDSFFTENTRAGAAAYAFSHRHPGVKFAIRTVDDGTRIWRIA